jgi:hypothetical protein
VAVSQVLGAASGEAVGGVSRGRRGSVAAFGLQRRFSSCWLGIIASTRFDYIGAPTPRLGARPASDLALMMLPEWRILGS